MKMPWTSVYAFVQSLCPWIYLRHPWPYSCLRSAEAAFVVVVIAVAVVAFVVAVVVELDLNS